MFYNECKYQKRFYWTFRECLEGGVHIDKADFLFNNEDLLNVLTYMIGEGGYSSPLYNGLSGEWSKDEYGALADLIVKRFLNEYCFYTESEEFDMEKCLNWFGKLFYVIEMTSPRYLTLMKAYSDSQDNLLSPVETKTTGSNRFNDTPQDEGDFANDEHTTNISEMENTIQNDLDSKMGRIREIESNYSNLLLQWSNEFESLFTEKINI